jgi:hypothetical protein
MVVTHAVVDIERWLQGKAERVDDGTAWSIMPSVGTGVKFLSGVSCMYVGNFAVARARSSNRSPRSSRSASSGRAHHRHAFLVNGVLVKIEPAGGSSFA